MASTVFTPLAPTIDSFADGVGGDYATIMLLDRDAPTRFVLFKTIKFNYLYLCHFRVLRHEQNLIDTVRV
jgi:hypothetical protein